MRACPTVIGVIVHVSAFVLIRETGVFIIEGNFRGLSRPNQVREKNEAEENSRVDLFFREIEVRVACAPAVLK